MTFFEYAYLADKLERLLTYALEPETCQKVFISGQCPHEANRDDRMHKCCDSRTDHYYRFHVCECGKQWSEV